MSLVRSPSSANSWLKCSCSCSSNVHQMRVYITGRRHRTTYTFGVLTILNSNIRMNGFKKLQAPTSPTKAPSTKLQHPEKLQTPRSNSCIHATIDNWSLKFLWSLDVGAWSLISFTPQTPSQSTPYVHPIVASRDWIADVRRPFVSDNSSCGT